MRNLYIEFFQGLMIYSDGSGRAGNRCTDVHLYDSVTPSE